jgi:5-methylcytosine-specific restriction endonuclease McrA
MGALTANDDGAAIAFGQRILALLDTGSFTASYKYAVLLAVLDAVLEGTDEHGRPPTMLHGRDIGRRVLELYWPQARPFTDDGPLAQSRQRDLVRKIAEFRVAHHVPEHATVERVRMQHPDAFGALEREVVATVVRYPIPLLQKIGAGGRAVERPFIYTYGWRMGVGASVVHSDGFDDRMHLIDDAGEHLAALAGLLRPVIEREWLQFVAARNDANVEELRLQRFLFGSERIGLVALVEPLHAVQDGRCFYCVGSAGGGWEIDHFLPWARLPDNKLDNLVLAHARCNNDKRAALASLEHLARWTQRFDPAGQTSQALDQVAAATAWPRRPAATLASARALYLHQPAGTPLWLGRPGRVEELDRDRLLGVLRTDIGLAADERGSYEV